MDSTNNYPIPQIVHTRLRELRLWHWKLGLKHRQGQYDLEALQNTHKKSSSLKDCIKTYSDAANVHFTAVQTLNEFFPIGDTAERDAENESNKR